MAKKKGKRKTILTSIILVVIVVLAILLINGSLTGNVIGTEEQVTGTEEPGVGTENPAEPRDSLSIESMNIIGGRNGLSEGEINDLQIGEFVHRAVLDQGGFPQEVGGGLLTAESMFKDVRYSSLAFIETLTIDYFIIEKVAPEETQIPTFVQDEDQILAAATEVSEDSLVVDETTESLGDKAYCFNIKSPQQCNQQVGICEWVKGICELITSGNDIVEGNDRMILIIAVDSGEESYILESELMELLIAQGLYDEFTTIIDDDEVDPEENWLFSFLRGLFSRADEKAAAKDKNECKDVGKKKGGWGLEPHEWKAIQDAGREDGVSRVGTPVIINGKKWQKVFVSGSESCTGDCDPETDTCELTIIVPPMGGGDVKVKCKCTSPGTKKGDQTNEGGTILIATTDTAEVKVETVLPSISSGCPANTPISLPGPFTSKRYFEDRLTPGEASARLSKFKIAAAREVTAKCNTKKKQLVACKTNVKNACELGISDRGKRCTATLSNQMDCSGTVTYLKASISRCVACGSSSTAKQVEVSAKLVPKGTLACLCNFLQQCHYQMLLIHIFP